MKDQLTKAKTLLTEAWKQISDHAVGDKIADVSTILDELIAASDSCEVRACSYYKHYLVYYDPAKTDVGPRMEHEAYHAAEEKCSIAQKRVLDWYDTNEGNDKKIPETYERQANYWEKRVCA